jgi:hypothetical protein
MLLYMSRSLALRVAGAVFSTFVIAACAAPSGDDEDLSSTGSAVCSDYDAAQGARIARAARSREGYHSGGLCYRYVKNHLESAGIEIRDYLDARDENSAFAFTRWANSSPRELAEAGLAQKKNVDMDDLPIGSVLVWSRGECGYNRTHGHIEIVISPTRACSDFCGTIKRGCGTPDVFVPVRDGGTCR